ncbi:YesL family protein [Metabacillus idriensis]|uniref:YesL family protein n=1 Tax=Metabacillus idriensis TaxID=324768 RepID=UPI00163A558B|nr:YesL family protein [Metabacillus idriensis]QNG59353.1 YesL family protein [Bacillus sp. PAMC26568]
MSTGWVTGNLYRLCDWFYRLAFLNLIWIAFTLAGFILFGIFPSTTAAFSVIRKWLRGEKDVPLVRTFWQSYRKEFIHSNKLGILFGLTACILLVDLKFVQTLHGVAFISLTSIFSLLIILFVFTLIYIFPVYVHYELRTLLYIRQAFFIAIVNPIQTILLVLASVLSFYVTMMLSGLFLFFGISGISLLIMWYSLRIFMNMDMEMKKHLAPES